jgi:hypothetical protein
MGRSISEDWDVHASADIQNLFFDPKAPKAIVRDAFLVQQGNIYVTQVRLTFLLRPKLTDSKWLDRCYFSIGMNYSDYKQMNLLLNLIRGIRG